MRYFLLFSTLAVAVLIYGAIYVSACSAGVGGYDLDHTPKDLPQEYRVNEAYGSGGFWCVCLRDAQRSTNFCSWMHSRGFQVMGPEGKPLECFIPSEASPNAP